MLNIHIKRYTVLAHIRIMRASTCTVCENMLKMYDSQRKRRNNFSSIQRNKERSVDINAALYERYSNSGLRESLPQLAMWDCFMFRTYECVLRILCMTYTNIKQRQFSYKNPQEWVNIKRRVNRRWLVWPVLCVGPSRIPPLPFVAQPHSRLPHSAQCSL